jgi:hypothetical protein
MTKLTVAVGNFVNARTINAAKNTVCRRSPVSTLFGIITDVSAQTHINRKTVTDSSERTARRFDYYPSEIMLTYEHGALPILIILP